MGDEGLEAGAYFFRSGSRVGGERDEPGGHHDLGAEGLIERRAAGGEGRGDGGVGVNDGLDLRTDAVDGEVHADLAGDVSSTGELVAVDIEDDHVRSAQEGFAAAGGGGE